MKFEVTVLSSEETLLLSASKVSVDTSQWAQIKRDVENVEDWNLFIKKAISSKLSPLIYKNLIKLSSEGRIPQSVITTFRRYYVSSLILNQKKYEEFYKLAKNFNNNRIDFIPLKGILLAKFIYKDIATRPMSDIDLLFQYNDLEKVVNILVETGWILISKPHKSKNILKLSAGYHPYSFVKEGLTLEIHKHIHTFTASYSVNIDDYWLRAKEFSFDGITIMRLNPTDFLQHLSIHLFKDLITGKQNIKSFVDISEYVKQFINEIDWALLKRTSQTYNCISEIAGIFDLCIHYFDLPSEANEFLINDASRDFDFDKIFRLLLSEQVDEAQDYVDKIKSHYYKDSVLGRLQKTEGMKGKMNYILHSVFPSKQFMKEHYSIKNDFKVYMYYFYRILSLFFKRMRKKQPVQ